MTSALGSCVTSNAGPYGERNCTRDGGGPSEVGNQALISSHRKLRCQKQWWCCVKKTRERHAVREMKECPSESPCRRRLQTTMSCFGQMPRWLTSWSKGVVLITSGMEERDERKRTSVEASKCFQTTSKLRAHRYFRKSMAGTYQGGVVKLVGICCDAISGGVRLSDQAARSIG
jgi:hypothetical protein